MIILNTVQKTHKIIKDPIYGYINIPVEIFEVIDSPAFQRLRDIVQTSYTSLYPSAAHNRFSHSLGVYYLGTLVTRTLKKHNFHKETNNTSLDYFPIFEYACLLHDVGHAPFSHTGETFFLKGSNRTPLHRELGKLVKDKTLELEINNNGYKAAPHELISAIIGIKLLNKKLNGKESFFARCITGYKYTIDLDDEKKFQNNLIELLNSKIIDVDKLDYLLRDSFFSGIEAISIDYERLLSNLCFVSANENTHQEIGYNKNAVSVLENVIYAHDLERKWIQSHPSIIYESYLLETLIEKILKEKINKDIIDISLLTEEGSEFTGAGKIKLLSDSTIIHLIKTLDDDSFAKEYLDRRIRKKPLWKSESEFNAIFINREKEIKTIIKEFQNLEKYINSVSGNSFVINTNTIKMCDDEIAELKKIEEPDEKNKEQLNERKKYKKLMELIMSSIFTPRQKKKSEVVVKFAKQFVSGFSKKEFSTLKINFPYLEKPCNFGDVTSILKSPDTEGENLFYIFAPTARKKDAIKTHSVKLIEFADQTELKQDKNRFV